MCSWDVNNGNIQYADQQVEGCNQIRKGGQKLGFCCDEQQPCTEKGASIVCCTLCTDGEVKIASEQILQERSTGSAGWSAKLLSANMQSLVSAKNCQDKPNYQDKPNTP